MLRLLLIFIISGTLAGCATNPVTGKTELNLVSQQSEIAIGSQQYVPAQQSQGGEYQVDAGLTAYVQQVGSRLAAVSDSELPYEFVVLNNSVPNAWALPGGKIAINRGLLVTLDSEAELAAVLGHEIVHAAARHGAKSMERGMLLQGAILLTAISTSDSDYANYIMGGASLGAQLITQRYGRDAELEADYYGTQYMARAGYDPAAAISLQEKFVKLGKSQSSSWLEGLFASHPPSQQRVEKNTATSRELKSLEERDWESGKDRFTQQLAYLRSKADAYAAADQANVLASKKETEVALKRLDKAIAIEPKEARFYGQKANILHSNKEYQKALIAYNQALGLDDGYFEYFLGRGLTYSKLGDRDKARNDLERSNQLLPTAIATNELGGLALQAGDRTVAKGYFAEVARSGGPLSQSATANFIGLDLNDNPSNYLPAIVARQEDKIVVTVLNKSGLSISGATVRLGIVVNGEARSVDLVVGRLQANERQSVAPGWRLRSSDIVEGASAVVIRAAL